MAVKTYVHGAVMNYWRNREMDKRRGEED